MKVRRSLLQSCLTQKKWASDLSTLAPALKSARKGLFQCAFAPKQLLKMYIKKLAACLHNAARWCDLIFLSDPHCRQESAINYSISWQTMSPLIDPNRIVSPRTHYAINRAAIVSGTGEPLLHARNR
jgi:hypothetical protein